MGVNLEDVGIKNYASIWRNLSYDELYTREIDPARRGLEKGVVTTLDAVSVDTGTFTGRSPKDKYLVKESSTADTIWWASGNNGSDNKPITEQSWESLRDTTVQQLTGKNLFIQDGFCGANPNSRLRIRVITEVAWAAHFTKNMFIRPQAEELVDFEPDWTILHACKTTNKRWKSMGLHSDVYVAFNIAERLTLIGGTWYGGEIKKGIFSMMNYFLPQKGIGSFHCSANVGERDDTALFFGLSGTGKTTLSTDPKRHLIGDDEHGWDDEGVFNFEGGCYAKTINLSPETEPDIYNAIKRNALLENVVVDKDGHVDFSSSKKTENTRVSYPIYHIKNTVKPVSKGPHAKTIIFLTCDAFGILPPVASLTKEQAMYQYLSGYTAKVAGTERGITEPKATFSPCFGGPFLTVHPSKYADILGSKIDQHHAKAYLVNTGWTGGGYGTGTRISLKVTRAIINSILNGTIEDASFENMPVFNLKIPLKLEDIDPKLLNPINNWNDKAAYNRTLNQLASMFIANLERFTDSVRVKSLVAHGPVHD